MRQGFSLLSRTPRRGLTLMELAVVFGIMGTVLGVIFTALPSVSRNIKINRATESLPMIVTNVRALYASRGISYAALAPAQSAATIEANVGAVGATEFTKYTQPWIAAGVFPSDMVSGGVVKTPWGGGVVQGALAGVAGAPVQFVLSYSAVPFDYCPELLRQTAATQDDRMVLQSLYVNGAAVVVPVTVATATAACPAAGATATIDWYFKLGGD